MSNKLIILFNILTEFSPGEEKWLTLPLADSYEYEIINDQKQVYNVQEYRRFFLDQGLSIEHLEIQYDIPTFATIEDLKAWIFKEMAPHTDPVQDALFVETYFEQMKEKGWLECEDGKIRFPRKQLLVLLHKNTHCLK